MRINRLMLSNVGLYITLFLMIYSMGTPYGDRNSMSYRIIILGLVLFLMIINHTKVIPKSAMLTGIILIAITIMSMVINIDTDIISYMGFIIIIVSCLMFVICCTQEKYETIFVNIVLVLCVSSLVFYALGLLVPSFVMSLPNFWDNKLKHFYHMYYYQNTYALLGGFKISPRNTGMFREPGVFQIYINMAAFLALRKNKISNIKMLVFFVTLFTTLSSAGILAGIPIVYLYWRRVSASRTLNRRRLYVIALLIICIFAYFVYQNMDMLFYSKIVEDGTAGASVQDRINCILSDLKFFSQSPLWGVGITSFADGIGAQNAFTSLAAIYGLTLPIIMIIGLWRFCSLGTSRSVLVASGFLSLMISHSLQSVLVYPGFFLPVMYGLVSYRGRRL